MMKPVLRRPRQALQSALRRHGIDVRKAPASFAPVPVFCLAVEALMARRGDSLTFVQVGANDGMFGDPLRPYILAHGWRGVLVEPQIGVFERLKANYETCSDRLVFENLAISSHGHLTLYLPPTMLQGKNYTHAYSIVSSDPRVISRQLGIPESELNRVEVPAMTLDALLAKHKIAHLDILQVDAEGYDWEVLQTLDLRKVSPTIIQLETGHLKRTALSEMAEHLNRSGYLIYYGGLQGDSIAIKRDFFAGIDQPLPSWHSRADEN